MTSDQDRRSEPRYEVKEPCHATIGGNTYNGSVVNIALSGAAIRLTVRLDGPVPPWQPMELVIDRIGNIHSKLVRPIIGGVAVEFVLDEDRDKKLIERLEQVLNDYAGEA